MVLQTDAASVLFEAINHIKFLQDQVHVINLLKSPLIPLLAIVFLLINIVSTVAP